MVPRRPPCPCCWTVPPDRGGQTDPVPDLQPPGVGSIETAAGLTPQQVRRVCTADSVSALARDPHTIGADPAGLAWSAICCTV